MYICIYIYMYIYIHMYVVMHMYMYIHIYIHRFICGVYGVPTVSKTTSMYGKFSHTRPMCAKSSYAWEVFPHVQGLAIHK